MTSILQQFINGDSQLTDKKKRDLANLKITQSTLFLISVPPLFHNKSYAEMFDALVLEHKIVPIGLMKCKQVITQPRAVLTTSDPTST